MTVLALDGALHAFSVALADDEGIRASAEIDGKRALESGLGCVVRVLKESRVAPQAISRVAVGVGPGSFTGIRIAVSYAKALAGAWRLPLVAISSFDILEGDTTHECSLAAVTGRPGVVCARFRHGSLEERACGPARDVLDRILPRHLSSVPFFGDAEDVLGVLAERGFDVERMTSKHPPAAAAALLARTREPAASLHAVRPEYGELPAARVPRFGKTR